MKTELSKNINVSFDGEIVLENYTTRMGIVLDDEELFNFIHFIRQLPIGNKAGDKLKELYDRDFKLSCLEDGGVDNWEWYSESLKDYWGEEEEEYED